jgi:predicted ATPase/DNA-binding CsgD family transcriptional regulator
VDLSHVTPRERAVLELLGEHLTHQEIGQKLFISPRTVESHVASLRRKLGVPNHRGLVRFASAYSIEAARVAAPSLTVPLTSFVGRRREVEELTRALRDSRLVSVVGPGGAGKTRLALAAALSLATAFTDGVRLVDLVPVVDADDLEVAVARACGFDPTSRRGPVEALISGLRPLHVLLLLDNCERQVHAVALLTDRLLNACPGLTMIITSRVRLAMALERVYRLEGLSPGTDGDAVALFVERATAAGSPTPSTTDLERIDGVCRSVAGLALAVELAAVQLPSLGLDGMKRGMIDQGSLLVGGSRLDSRQGSMHETLDWSVAMLEPPAAAVLFRLAVLTAPFDLDTATRVTAFPPVTTLAMPLFLRTLVEHNLVATTTTSTGELVFRLLEPVRQYGLARMSQADMPAFTHHLLWCLAMVESAVAGDEIQGMDRVVDDVRFALAREVGQDLPHPAAHALARAFGLVLFRWGRLREAQQRMEQAADLTADDREAVTDLATAAAVAKCRVLGSEALRLELDAAARARAAGANVAAALALVRAAELLHRFPGMFAAPDIGAAASFLEQAHELAPDDHHVQVAATVAAANARPGQGAERRDRAVDALDAARDLNDSLLVSAALDAACNERIHEGDVVAAYRLAVQRVERLMARPDQPNAGLEIKDALHVAAFCALGAGDLNGARAMAERQHELPFLVEQRDLADEELLAPAALAGDWELVLGVGQRFLEDWTEAGKPKAPGRGLAPAAVALAHGLRGDVAERAAWLRVLAEIRGVSAAEATRGSGYGEVFDALVFLEQDQPVLALESLTSKDRSGMFGFVFRQWSAALSAEAAVLARHEDAAPLLCTATQVSVDNPVAMAITRRAEALVARDRVGMQQVADDFLRAGSPYQQRRTLTMAESM